MQRILVASLIWFASCESPSRQIEGEVTEVKFIHIGVGKSKQKVTYKFNLSGIDYEAQETFYFRWQGDYFEGDSVWVEVNLINPQKSEIIGLIKKPRNMKNVIKLESIEK